MGLVSKLFGIISWNAKTFMGLKNWKLTRAFVSLAIYDKMETLCQETTEVVLFTSPATDNSWLELLSLTNADSINSFKTTTKQNSIL